MPLHHQRREGNTMTSLTPEQHGMAAEGFHTAYAILRASTENDDEGAGRLVDQLRARGDLDEAVRVLQCLSILAALVLQAMPPAVREEAWENLSATIEAIEGQQP
jgi:hypothetical protein